MGGELTIEGDKERVRGKERGKTWLELKSKREGFRWIEGGLNRVTNLRDVVGVR